VSAYSGRNCHLKVHTLVGFSEIFLRASPTFWAEVATVRDQWREFYFPALLPTGVQKKLLMMIPPDTIQDILVSLNLGRPTGERGGGGGWGSVEPPKLKRKRHILTC